MCNDDEKIHKDLNLLDRTFNGIFLKMYVGKNDRRGDVTMARCFKKINVRNVQYLFIHELTTENQIKME